MECPRFLLKNSSKDGSFSSKVINILETTTFEGVGAFSGSTKRLNVLNAFETSEKMRPFVEWFSSSITKDNCITREELLMYKNLKTKGKLIPEEDLDNEISSFCEESSDLYLDFEPGFDIAKKESEALESLDNFLRKVEKKKQKGPSLEYYDEIVRNELKEFDTLNKNMNKALENYSTSWEDLSEKFSHDRRVCQEKMFEESIKKINELTNYIDKNLNYLFKEAESTPEKPEFPPEDYWLIWKTFTKVRDEVINVVAITEGLLLFKKRLMKLKEVSLSTISSLDDIRDMLHEDNTKYELRRVLTDSLQEEINSIASFKLLNEKCFSAFLAGRLDILSKIEHVLRQKKLYNHAFAFVIQRFKVIQDFQFEKLHEGSKNIASDVSAFQQRMDTMSTYLPKKEECIEPNFIDMMNCLNITQPGLQSLDEGIAALHRLLKEAENLIHSNFLSIEQSVIKRLVSIEKRNNTLIDGATRETFNQIQQYKAHLQSVMKTQRGFENKASKIRQRFNEMQMNANSKNDCLWMKFLINPADFVYSVLQMEEELSY